LADVLAMAVLASGCGGGTGVASPSDVDLANGQKKFQVTCGGCHTLAAAGSKGTIGPNLDAAYQQPAMPAELLTGKDAEDVAAYVAAAACNPCPAELTTGG